MAARGGSIFFAFYLVFLLCFAKVVGVTYSIDYTINCGANQFYDAAGLLCRDCSASQVQSADGETRLVAPNRDVMYTFVWGLCRPVNGAKRILLCPYWAPMHACTFTDSCLQIQNTPTSSPDTFYELICTCEHGEVHYFN